MATIDKRRQSDGTITYRARIRRQGHKTRAATFNTRGEALAWARAIEGAIDRGTYTDDSEARATTLADALDRYEREITPTKKGAKQEKLRIAAWRQSELAGVALTNIRGMDLAAWRDKRIAQGRAATTVRNDLSVLCHLYRIARTEWGMTGLQNPCDDIRRPTPGKARERRLEPGEEEKLLEAAEPQLRAAIIILIETAMRRAELTDLTWSRINKRAKVARLEDTKNGTARDVPLSARAIAALEQLPRRLDGKLISYNPDTLTHKFGDAARAAGITGLRLHDLRHEGTSRLVESGKFNLVEVAAITGHKTMIMLKRYSHPRAEELARRMDAG